MAAAWLPLLVTGLGMVTVGIALWLLVLPPGDRRKLGVMHYVLWSFLACGLALLVAAVPCGLARDIELQAIPPAACRPRRGYSLPARLRIRLASRVRSTIRTPARVHRLTNP